MKSNDKPNNILVTGGAGYLGSVLVRELMEIGYNVRIFDRCYFGKDSVKELVDNPKFEFVQGDIRNLKLFPKLLDGIDAVIHLCALANDPSAELRKQLTEAINYDGTCDLVDLCIQKGVQRFIFASSCSTYGAAGEKAVDETSLLRPVSWYSKLKVKAEEYLMEKHAENPDTFHPVILRNATVFGASPRMRFDLAINIMTLHAMQRKKVMIFGGGKQWRPLIHIKDVTRLIRNCLDLPLEKVSGQIYNVGGSSRNIQIVDLGKKIQSFFDDVELIMVPAESDDSRSYRVSFDKVKNEIGFEPEFTFEQGIQEVAALIHGGCLADTTDKRYYNLQTMKYFLDLPVVDGGEAIRDGFLPLCLPLLGKEEEEEVIDTLRSGWITTGPKTSQFERDIGLFIENNQVIALNSCTAALHLSLVVNNIGRGDEVIVPAIGFASTANVVIHTGAKPVFVDVEKDTLNIDPAKIEKAITSKTKAIIPVHMAGQPCKLDEIQAIAKKHNLIVIEDAAHAISARYKGRPIGNVSDLTCFSFYPTKNMTTIEGGILAYKDPELKTRLRELSLHGMSWDAWKRYSETGSLHYEIVDAGFKYNMTDVQAAVGLHQLKRLPEFQEKRKELTELYTMGLEDLPELELLKTIEEVEPSYHLYIIKVDYNKLTKTRDEFADALKKENIGIGFHFRAFHCHKFYKTKYKLNAEDFPVADEVSKRIISLPLYPKMTIADAESAIKGVKKLINAYRKSNKK